MTDFGYLVTNFLITISDFFSSVSETGPHEDFLLWLSKLHISCLYIKRRVTSGNL